MGAADSTLARVAVHFPDRSADASVTNRRALVVPCRGCTASRSHFDREPVGALGSARSDRERCRARGLLSMARLLSTATADFRSESLNGGSVVVHRWQEAFRVIASEMPF